MEHYQVRQDSNNKDSKRGIKFFSCFVNHLTKLDVKNDYNKSCYCDWKET